MDYGIKDNSFTPLTMAYNLAVYTIGIIKNPKTFPPEYNHAITDRISDAVLTIYTAAKSANDIRVDSDLERASERLELIKESRNAARNLLAYIDIAHKVFHLGKDRFTYWSIQADDVRIRISKWYESEKQRYKALTC